MTHEGDVDRVARYQRVLHAAYSWAFDPEQVRLAGDSSWSQLRDEVVSLLTRNLPAEGERMFHVSPETLAPFVSLLQQTDPTLGFYVLVDIGACTTEVLVVCLKKPGDDDRQFVSYWDATDYVGGNDFQVEGDVDAQSATERLEKHIRYSLYRSFRKDCKNHNQRERWRRLILLESGGGVLDPHARSVLQEKVWLRRAMQHFEVEVHPMRHSPDPNDLRVSADGSRGNASRGHFHMGCDLDFGQPSRGLHNDLPHRLPPLRLQVGAQIEHMLSTGA